MFKKLLALTLVVTIGMGTTAFAQNTTAVDPYNTTVLEDNSGKKIVETSDANFTYQATFDKINNTVTLSTTDKISGEIKTGSTTAVTPLQEFPNNPVTYASLAENTFTNYEYTITYGNPNKWQLRRPGDNVFNWVYFDTYQATGNKDYLVAFQNAVDNINVQEGTIVGTLGMAGLSYLAAGAAGAGAIFTGGTLSGAAWGALLAAGGFSTAHVAACMAYDQSCKNAYDSYWNAYYNSTIL